VDERIIEPWLEALHAVARQHGVDRSLEQARVEAGWLAAGTPLDEMVETLARRLGLSVAFTGVEAGLLDAWHLPLIADLGDGQVAVVEQLDDQCRARVRLSGEHGLVTGIERDVLLQRARRMLIARPIASLPDARVDEYIRPFRKDWLSEIIWNEWPRYLDVMLASLVANVLTLSAMLFTMQVYDRVIPAQSEPTLWVLFGGLLIALTFAFAMRVLRAYTADQIGKRADLRISDRVFGHALRIRADARPQSTATLISQLRELEQIRELVTSTTIGALADLPFFLLFLVVMWLIGGWLVLVPLAALPVLLVPGLLAQRSLARLSREGMREAAVRNGLIVEAMQGVDDIKLLRAEARFQSLWNGLNTTLAGIGTRQRFLTGLLMSWTQEVQTLVYACVVLAGAYPAMSGELSTGVLVACSMLASRMVAPLGQLTGVLVRWQQAKVAREGLDQLMQRPLDQGERDTMLQRPVIRGQYTMRDVRFFYGDDRTRPVLDIAALEIGTGERVAVLGRNGAGKSTLLQVLSGLQVPQEGVVQLDGVRTSLIDPMDLRRDVALLGQQASLFHGTVRDNLTLGMPNADEEVLLRALRLSGADRFVDSLHKGLDHPVQEGGRGLSGGQRQTLLLARSLVREPNVLLLDEPTAWLDDASERQFIRNLDPWLQGRTLVVATHRPAVLRWVQRVIVLDAGCVVADGPRQEIRLRDAGTRKRASS